MKKLLVIVIICLFFVGCRLTSNILRLSGLTSTHKWFADKNTGCKVWSYSSYTGTVTWSGQCVNGIAQGKGTVQWYRDNAVLAEQIKGYVGEVKMDRYVGEMKDGKRHGKGKHIWGKEVQNDNGNIVYEIGEIYEGDFVVGNFTGKGKYTYGNRVYEGDFVDAQFSGFGTCVNCAGIHNLAGDFGQLRQESTSFSNMFTDVGDGDKYIGEWKHGKRDGHGTQWYADGSKYTGEWKRDKKVGKPVDIFGAIGAVYGAAIVNIAENIDTSRKPGTLYLKTGSICGKGNITVKSTYGTENLECCGWGNLGQKEYYLSPGPYVLKYTIKSCSGKHYSGLDINFSIEENRETVIELDMDANHYRVKHN